MGVCASCLKRRHDVYDEDDEAQHLFDDPNNMHYGSFDPQQMNGHEDPQEVQRELEALQRVVARTADNLVDVYEITPQDHNRVAMQQQQQQQQQQQASPHTTFAYPGQQARMARYQALLSKLSGQEGLVPAVAHLDWGAPPHEDGQYPAGDDATPMEMQRGGSGGSIGVVVPVRVEDGEALVGNFSDAAAAMR